ncbi:Calcium-activated chloride channel regulator 1 [Lamellibrachia satsuma]|nr:Calcium-activated chloride channel regulator 1 [Lamellibrachia satsuma]
MSRIFAAVVAWFTFVLVADTTLASSPRSKVKLVNNGYEDLVVAIAESVPDSQSTTAIARIKEIRMVGITCSRYLSMTFQKKHIESEHVQFFQEFFTQASHELFIATNQRVYFRNITILVPKHWGNGTYYNVATTETFNTATFRIDGLGKGGMSTRSYGGCGEEGLFIAIPKIYMTGDLKNMSDYFGPPGNIGRIIVHEWGQFRWGLGKEYPVTKKGYPSFYHGKGRTVEAVKCGKHLKGTYVDKKTRKSCTLSKTTGLPTNTCYFREDKTNPGVTASLMDFHWIPQVTTFCDNDENNKATLHNAEAPSHHNNICKRKSCWEVMRDHADFHNGNNPALPLTQNTEPTFRVVQGKAKRIVLVLDVSGSMDTSTNGVTRIQRLRQTAADFLLKVVPQEYSVGIVTFSTGASTVAHLTTITDESVRQTLAAKLPSMVRGSTAIGLGLQKGVQVLEANSGSASGGTLILVSDGGENRRPHISDVTPTLVQKSVTVHTILISDGAEPKLIKLAADTNGKSFFDSGSLDSTELFSAFRSTITDEDSGTPGATPVEILLESIWIAAKEKVNKTVSIDSSVGRDTEFTFSYTGTTFTLNVVVISPSGVNYTTDGPNGHDNEATKQMAIVIKNQTEIPLSDPSTLKVIVRAELRKGYEPVIGADVEVQVGSLPWKPMLDDGLGVDTTRDDGFYSVALLKFQGNGKFPLKVRATSKDGDQTQLFVGGDSSSFYPPNGEAEDTGPVYGSVGQFDRTKAAGLLKVVHLTSRTDLYALYPFPPAEVRDLRVNATSYEEKTVTLEWTAVGDYADEETASSYDIRFSTDIQQLIHSFENASQLDDSDVIRGNLSSPLSPSETETFVIRFRPEYVGTTLFFGLKVSHSRGRISEVSNIDSAAIASEEPLTSEPPSSEPPSSEPPSSEPPSSEPPSSEPNYDSGVSKTTFLGMEGEGSEWKGRESKVIGGDGRGWNSRRGVGMEEEGRGWEGSDWMEVRLEEEGMDREV